MSSYDNTFGLCIPPLLSEKLLDTILVLGNIVNFFQYSLSRTIAL